MIYLRWQLFDEILRTYAEWEKKGGNGRKREVKCEQRTLYRPKTPRAIDIHRARYSIRHEEAGRGRKLRSISEMWDQEWTSRAIRIRSNYREFIHDVVHLSQFWQVPTYPIINVQNKLYALPWQSIISNGKFFSFLVDVRAIHGEGNKRTFGSIRDILLSCQIG